DPRQWNRNDGFAPGSMMLTRVPGLDLEVTGAVRLGDISASLAEDAPILVIDAEPGERQLIWAELGAYAASDDQRTLLIRPARNLEEGRRYIVALRDLRDADGDAIEAGPLFSVYRDGLDTGEAVWEQRRPAMDDVFDRLEAAGVARDS